LITEKSAPIESEASVRLVSTHGKTTWKRRAAVLGRWLHIYLSMASFAILFFFAVTGLTLNHAEWFSGREKTVHVTGQVAAAWVKVGTATQISKLDVVEYLRRTHGIKGALSDFRVDEQQCEVSFKGPGYTADAFIDRTTGKYDLTENRMGIIAVMNDLHKGRDTGNGWSVVIDIAAILMTLVSITGMALIFFLPKRRSSGLLIAIVGLALILLAYLVWGP
jgi:uncharacterized protein